MKITKSDLIEFNSELSRLGISYTTFYNWRTLKTKIPVYILNNEKEFLRKFLRNNKTLEFYGLIN